MIDFVLVADKDNAHVESVRPHVYQGLEPDPAAARRLKLLAKAAAGPSTKALSLGDSVPHFTRTAQNGKQVSLSELRGKVTALNFVYTRCALRNFCLRRTNNFGDLQTGSRKS
jgi:cytochrome oxidase Cu insertion factor (SCO1/SenC/PrrC family)